MYPHVSVVWARQGESWREPTGSTLLKRRQLGQLGYTPAAVPYWEWDDLEGKVPPCPRFFLRLFLYYSGAQR